MVLSAVLAVLLLASGLVIYDRTRSELDVAIDQGLRSRTGDLTALVKQADKGLAQAGRSPLTTRGEGFAQILDTKGHIVDSSSTLRHVPLLTRSQLRRAARQSLVVSRMHPPADHDWARVRATPVNAQGQRLIVVVGATLEQRDDALANLRTLLLFVGAGALLLASLAGYVAVRGALRPVELMTTRARGIQAASLARRLPVPQSGDELTRLGQTLNAMLDRLQAGFAHERAFVDDASHELRSPLTILKGELDLALRDATTVEEFRHAVAAASEEADRVVALAEGLLILARADQGQLSVDPTAFSARELLEEVGERFSLQASELGAVVQVVADDQLVLLADRAGIARAVSNLVENALRYGGRQVTLMAESNGRAVIRVSDDGPGFPSAFLPTAFERFTRADEARGRGGSGLGMSIVAAVAQAHGGSADAANRADGGGEVTITLPAARTQQRPPAEGAGAAV
jgi:signal transduction histidine kinase